MLRKIIIAATAVAFVGSTAAAVAKSPRIHHHQGYDPAPYSRIDSGYGPPRSWDEIEISHPEGGG